MSKKVAYVTGGMGGIACDIAGALAMADDPEALRPALHRLESLYPAVSDEDLNVRLGNRFLGVGVWTRFGEGQQPSGQLTSSGSRARVATAPVTGTGSGQCVFAAHELAGRREVTCLCRRRTSETAPFPRS